MNGKNTTETQITQRTTEGNASPCFSVLFVPPWLIKNILDI